MNNNKDESKSGKLPTVWNNAQALGNTETAIQYDETDLNIKEAIERKRLDENNNNLGM